MTLESHRAAMAHPLPTCCEYHAAQLPDGCQQGELCPARQQAREAADRPPVTAAGTVTAVEKFVAVVLAVCLFAFVYGATRLVWPIVSASFTLWRNQQ